MQLCWKLSSAEERLWALERFMKGQRPKPTPSCQLPQFLPAVASLSPEINLPLPSCFWLGSHGSCPVSSSDVRGSVGSLTGDSFMTRLARWTFVCASFMSTRHFCRALGWKCPWEKNLFKPHVHIWSGSAFRTRILPVFEKFRDSFLWLCRSLCIHAYITGPVLSLLSSMWNLYS